MNGQVMADTGKAFSARAALPWPLAAAALFYLLLLLLGSRLLGDPDTYWQIALGQWIAAHHQVPQVDTFSFTMAGKAWISSQWLAQVVLAGLYALAGWSGVVVAAALAIAGAFALLTRFLLQRLAVGPALVLATGGFVIAAPHMLARPHALAMPVMVAWVAGLVRAAETRRAPSLWLLPLITLWANLHGSFTFGLALMAPVALDAVWNAQSSERVSLALHWVLFAALAVIAACVTPYGPQSILVTARVLDLGPALALIGEWRPIDFSKISGFELALLFGIGAALYRGLTLPPIRILILLGLVYMALSHGRNVDMLGLLGPLFIAAPLALQLGGPARADSGDGREHLLPSLALAGALLAATAGLSYALDYQPPARFKPQRAVAVIKAAGAKHVLNGYNYGGYLIASGVKTFIDGRTELYGKKFVLRTSRALELSDVGTMLRLLKEYDIDATLLAPDTPANSLLARLKGWKRAYADDVAVVYLRTGATPADGALELKR